MKKWIDTERTLLTDSAGLVEAGHAFECTDEEAERIASWSKSFGPYDEDEHHDPIDEVPAEDLGTATAVVPDEDLHEDFNADGTEKSENPADDGDEGERNDSEGAEGGSDGDEGDPDGSDDPEAEDTPPAVSEGRRC